MSPKSPAGDAAAPETYDVVVVGFGGAGACAALQAAEAGASVLVLDRFYGGGSTALSGGVVYAGGGTAQQKRAGVTDTRENMLGYLRRELGDAVSEETLRDFAYGSTEMISWLEQQGVEFEGSLCPYKTSYPTNEYYLYYSGNELVYTDAAEPAPRGHRAVAHNFSGKALFEALRAATERAGITVRTLAEVHDLLVEDGKVVGVEYTAPAPGAKPHRAHHAITGTASKMQNWYPPLGRALNRLSCATRPKQASYRVRARGGVVLSTGGFAFNETMVRQHIPAFQGAAPLGTIGDDGAAVRLGLRAGGTTAHMDQASGWRFISPPSAFVSSLVVDGEGRRIGNEQWYGATLSWPLMVEHGGRAYLIADERLWASARKQYPDQSAFFQRPQLAYLFSPVGHRKAATLDGLAKKLGIPADGVQATVDLYNASISAGRPDEFGKKDDVRVRLDQGPFYAIDCSVGGSKAYPLPFITLGGLAVDEKTGEVLSGRGAAVGGLYAAGRAASGLCSKSYVSGMSIADAVYSGRRAGRHAASKSDALHS
jgi:3-oxo-5alpha-steroid 4-dehydrogenase